MGYVLINGKRYYQDAAGNVTLDNVSQQEADHRERSNTTPPVISRSIPYGIIATIVILIMILGAFIYNHLHVSLAENAINDYMNAMVGNTETVIENTTETKVQDTLEEDVGVKEQTGYILPDSSERYLKAYEIENCTHDEIQLMINEIYARHGREFHSQDNIDYFNALDWYVPVSGKTDEEIVKEFNVYEKANVDLLSQCL